MHKQTFKPTKILIASSIDPDAVKTLSEQHDVICAFQANPEDLRQRMHDREVLIFRSGVRITADVMEAAPNLKLLVRAGSGLDNLDVEYVRRRGIQLVRIPEPGAQAVAELAFSLMLTLARNVLVADHLWRQGRWVKYQLNGYLLTKKTLGIVGVGNIGTRVGELGAAWGMRVIGCVEYPSETRAAGLQAKGIHLTDFDTTVSEADFLTFHVPLGETTRHMVNADLLGRVKPGAFLINTSRGGVVDEQALCEALRRGDRLRGAALDVHAQEGEGKISPLAGLDNVVLTPHIGAMAVDAQHEIGRRVIEIVDSFRTMPPGSDPNGATAYAGHVEQMLNDGRDVSHD